MTKAEQVLGLIVSRQPWSRIKIIAGVDEPDVIELFRNESRGPIARAFAAHRVDKFFWNLLDEAHPQTGVANGITPVEGEWQVGFSLPNGEVLDLGRWSDIATAKGIFRACRWIVTGRGLQPRPTHRTFVERKLNEASFNCRSSAA